MINYFGRPEEVSYDEQQRINEIREEFKRNGVDRDYNEDERSSSPGLSSLENFNRSPGSSRCKNGSSLPIGWNRTQYSRSSSSRSRNMTTLSTYTTNRYSTLNYNINNFRARNNGMRNSPELSGRTHSYLVHYPFQVNF